MEATEQLVQLKPFEIQKAKLQQLAKDCDIVVTDETFEEAKKNRKLLRDERFAIQNILKENKAIINTLKGDQEKKAEELIAISQPTEDKLDAGIKEIENRKEIEKEKKERAAQEKIAARIATLFENEMKFNGEVYELGENTISPVQVKVFSDTEFYTFLEGVKVEHLKILDQKRQEAEAKKAQEEALEKQRQEQEEEKRELEKQAHLQAKKLIEEREAFEEARKKAQEDIDRQKRELEAEKAAEQLKKIEEEEDLWQKRGQELIGAGYSFDGSFYVIPNFRKFNKHDIISLSPSGFSDVIVLGRNEIERVKSEQEVKLKKEQDDKAKRAEALRPDKEKLSEFALSLNEIKYPKLENEASNKIVDDAMTMILGAQEFINQSIVKL